MSDAISPRMYLVGRILPVLISRGDTPAESDDAVIEAVRLTDLTLNAMGWSDGKLHMDGAAPGTMADVEERYKRKLAEKAERKNKSHDPRFDNPDFARS